MAYRKYNPATKTTVAPNVKKVAPKASENAKPAKKVAPKASEVKKRQSLAQLQLQEKRELEALHRIEISKLEQDAALARGEATREKRRATMALKRAENAESMVAETRATAEEREAARERDSGTEHERFQRAAFGQPAPGRGAGKVAKTARANLYAAFEDMGGVEQLVIWGRTNPTEFYRIWARLIPVEVDDETKTLPLEVLLEKLSSRADMTVEAAARQIGKEALTEAAQAALVEDAAALFNKEV